MTWKKYLPKSRGFCRIKKTEFLILDKVELRRYCALPGRPNVNVTVVGSGVEAIAAIFS